MGTRDGRQFLGDGRRHSGLTAPNRRLFRAVSCVALGSGLLQGGLDDEDDPDWLAATVRPLAVVNELPAAVSALAESGPFDPKEIPAAA